MLLLLLYPAWSSETPPPVETDDDWNVVASDLREKDRPPTIFSQYAHLSKKTQ